MLSDFVIYPQSGSLSVLLSPEVASLGIGQRLALRAMKSPDRLPLAALSPSLKPRTAWRLLMSAILVCFAASRSEAIDVYPSNTTIEAGSSRQFMAYVPMTPSTVEWLVNDAVGGSDTFGKISPTGA